jgi:O-6-methylguanine DNA methyltransferase
MTSQNNTFAEKVYALVSQIPAGKVMTYGQVAHLVNHPGAARAVGMCMKHNPDLSVIPCHRVVASDGRLTGYSAGEGIISKEEILLREGVKFIHDRVDLAQSQWFP